MENIQEQIDYPRGLTFEKVWASLQENAREMKEAHARTEAVLAETQKSMNKTIGDLNNKLGIIAENLLTPNLVENFKMLGFTFQIMGPHRRIYNDDNSLKTEIDVFLENSKQAMAVEVKTTCRRDDVDYHLARMEKVRRHADSHGDKRQLYGAIAATIIDEDTKRYALKNGFYLIEPSGENVTITKPDIEKVW